MARRLSLSMVAVDFSPPEASMADYRRMWVGGATFFFTVVTYHRSRFLIDPRARQALRNAIETCQKSHPFKIDAWVLLPDHLHALWTLPPDDERYDLRWGQIKRSFTQTWLANGGNERTVTYNGLAFRRRGVWQRRYWEHTIRDDRDFERHLDYIHYNPVKHQLVDAPGDWEFSTFHRWVRDGVYSVDWGRGTPPRIAHEEMQTGE